MSATSLTVTFSNSAADRTARSLLRLEQEDWGENPGLVSKAQLAQYLLASLFTDLYSKPAWNCVFDEGWMECSILAYPAYDSLPYNLHASYGILFGKVRDDLDEKEAIIFKNNNEATLKYLAQTVTSTSWIGDVYDEEGNVYFTNPEVTIVGDRVTLNKIAVGVLKIEYNVVRYTHSLRVWPRIDTQNVYKSAVYGLYPDGIAWVEITPPPYADVYALEKYDCGWRVGGYEGLKIGDTEFEDGDGGKSPPVSPGDNPKIVIDYCSQEAI